VLTVLKSGSLNLLEPSGHVMGLIHLLLYFEQISDEKTIMQHVTAPDIAISEVGEKEVQTKGENHNTLMQ
jgi:hypothetical protein